jgi:hypothetical protein
VVLPVKKYVVAVVLLSAAVIAGLVLWLRSDGAGAPSPADARRSRPTDAADVTKALERLETDPAALLSRDAAAAYGDRIAEAIPKGSGVTPIESSWRPDGVDGGTMLVTVDPPAAAPTTYAAIVVREDGAWKVAATVATST